VKRLALSIIVLFSISQLAAAAGDEEGGGGKTLLVKVTDRSENVTFELMSPADFKLLQTQLGVEERLHAKVLAATEKAWKEDEDTKKKSFPRGSIALRKAEKLREFADSSKASDALSKEEEKLADRDKAEKDKQAAKEKSALEKKTKTQAQLDKNKKKDAERDSVITSARNLYESKLQELTAQAEEGAAAGKEEPKKEEPKEAAKKK